MSCPPGQTIPHLLRHFRGGQGCRLYLLIRFVNSFSPRCQGDPGMFPESPVKNKRNRGRALPSGPWLPAQGVVEDRTGSGLGDTYLTPGWDRDRGVGKPVAPPHPRSAPPNTLGPAPGEPSPAVPKPRSHRLSNQGTLSP